MSGDGTARVWDIDFGTPRTPFLRHAGYVSGVAFTPDQKRLITAGLDGMVRIWELVPPGDDDRTVEMGGVVRTFQFLDDGRACFAAGDNGVLRIWNVRTGEALGPPMAHAGRVTGASLAPDGRQIVTISRAKKTGSSYDGEVTIWNRTDGTRAPTAIRADGDPLAVAFSPDGTDIITLTCGQVHWYSPNESLCIQDGPVTFTRWDAATGTARTTTSDNSAGACFAVLSPDGSFAAVASSLPEPGFQIWNTSAGHPVAARTVLEAKAKHLKFSPDGKRLAVATVVTSKIGSNATTQIFDTMTAVRVSALMPHSGDINFVAFSSDGKRLISASDDGTARVWDAPTGAPLTGSLRHQGVICHATFGGDGSRVVTGGIDKMVRVWDVNSGELLAPPVVHPGDQKYVFGAWCSPDGHSVITATEDGRCRTWHLASATEPIATLRKRASLYAAEQFDPKFGLVPVTPAELRKLWTELR